MQETMNAAEEKERIEWLTCRVCGVHGKNKTYTVKEMMYGTKKEFDYFVCENCKCMQIKDVPEDLGEYYQNDSYYSFDERNYQEFDGDAEHTEVKILDVGCGTGKYLLEMAEQGYGNLYGCDPFIEEDIRYGDRVYIRKCEISEMDGEYDVIRFGDSFEHVTNPLETLQQVKRLLKKEGFCWINLPVFPNAAFDTFGTNWYQIDAPRHIFLHSKESLRLLCEKSGLKVEKTEFNSNVFQFICSYFYEMGMSLKTFEKDFWDSIKEIDMETFELFEDATKKANEKEYGDHAVFYIGHNSEDER